ncbi:MAG: hypothetical protein NWE89_17695 [Candidatus Bathyarchaeota archaeon]|nr:hypothetical protein [Candidatus Bathyarchaeota archaeon]
MSDLYQRLLKAWEKEKATEELQNIPDGFINEMTQYVKELTKTEADTETLTGRITQKEKGFSGKMLRELINTRLGKIVRRELEGKPIDAKSLTPEEQRLHSNLRQLLYSFREGSELPPTEPIQVKTKPPPIAQPPKQAPPLKPVLPEKDSTELVVVRFMQQLPAIMGVDMKAYGPFNPEDVASIPRQNAVNLIRRGIAKLVELEP